MRERVREALAGEVVRGLVDLNPGGEAWKGARVHGNGRHGVDAFLPTDGRPALCIDRHGELVYARIEGRKVVVDPVEPDGVLVEDAEPYARALVVVLSRHCTASETTIRGYDHAAALAHRIRAALFGP
jgi:hypothetical protein